MSMQNNTSVHFVGIGGSGMSAIGELAYKFGYQVTGSDIKESPEIKRLKSAGISIFIGHDEKNVINAKN